MTVNPRNVHILAGYYTYDPVLGIPQSATEGGHAFPVHSSLVKSYKFPDAVWTPSECVTPEYERKTRGTCKKPVALNRLNRLGNFALYCSWPLQLTYHWVFIGPKDRMDVNKSPLNPKTTLLWHHIYHHHHHIIILSTRRIHVTRTKPIILIRRFKNQLKIGQCHLAAIKTNFLMIFQMQTGLCLHGKHKIYLITFVELLVKVFDLGMEFMPWI